MGDIQNDFVQGYKSEIEKKQGNVIFLAEDGLPSDVKIFVSTGATLLDTIAVNKADGGIPVGKITEIAGNEGTGKTLFAIQIAANAQKEGALIVYIDTEHAFNEDFASRIGLDISKNFLYMTPATLEDVFASMFALFKKLEEAEKKNKTSPYPYVVLIWDSIPASPPKEDLNAENPDPTSNVGLASRVLSKNLKLLLNESGRKNVAQVFVNQLRTNIGAQVFSDNKFITTGGKALPYYASLRFFLYSVGKIKVGDDVVGIKTKAKIKKTRFGPPHRDCDFNIYFTKGVDDTESIINFLEKKGVIKSRNGGQKGKLFWIQKERGDKGDTEENPALNKVEFKKKLKSDPQIQEYVKEQLEKYLVKELIDPDEHEVEEVENDD